MKRNKLDVVRVRLVRDHQIKWDQEPRYTDPDSIAAAARLYLGDTDREHFLAVLLDGKNRVASITEISVGTLNQSLVHPREVFKPALLANAAAILLVHNHPTGDCEPSREDIEITKRLREAGDILGIRVLDHIIISTETERHLSFSRRGLL